MQAPVQQPIFMPPPLPYYMMEMPAPLAMPPLAEPAPIPDPALGELKDKLSKAEEAGKQALANKDALIAKLKDTIKGDIATMQSLANERDQLAKRIIELEAQFASKTKDNDDLQHKIQAFAGLSDKLANTEANCALNQKAQGDSFAALQANTQKLQLALSNATADDDKDSVVNPSDKCPNTPAGTQVDAQGCPADTDGDGVTDSKDQCPGTASGTAVGADGCEKDNDKDGVVDSKDQCPTTPAGTKVGETGCEGDADKDGVVDSKDQCPTTPAGTKVGDTGCEGDADKDGVADSKDQCPTTPAGTKVGETGCEGDADKDGIVDSK
ncbi:MAG TPA: hypothetical protein EYG68_06755, partial [Leucothrix mucor]|nr:hypothetical protein [Leucothrix mucor]